MSDGEFAVAMMFGALLTALFVCVPMSCQIKTLERVDHCQHLGHTRTECWELEEK